MGCAKIAVEKVIPAMQRGDLTEVVAIASRDGAKAKDAAARLGLPKSHGSYEDLLADPEIDAVYNPLPNHLHVPWSIKALEAGKHVLCEKPIALSVAQAETLLTEAKKHPRLKLMEAFMYRHHPQWQTALRLVREGRIGEVRTIQSFFSYFNRDAANVRHKPEWGGGGLMDIGCYPISLSRFIFDAEPDRVCAIVENDPDFGVDRLASGVMDFASASSPGTATFTCSMQLCPFQRVHIFGTEGRVEIEIPFNAPPDRPCRLWHQTSAGVEEMLLPVRDQYTLQGDLFARAILNDSPVPTPIEDAVHNMRVIEAMFGSAASGAWQVP